MSTPAAGNTKIQASPTDGTVSNLVTLLTGLSVEVDGLQVNTKGNLIVVDATSGAKLINLATGVPGTVTNLTDGAACRTTVALYQLDAWCSDSTGRVILVAGRRGCDSPSERKANEHFFVANPLANRDPMGQWPKCH